MYAIRSYYVFVELIKYDKKKLHTEVDVMYVGRMFLSLILAGIFVSGCSTASIRNSLNRRTGFANVLQSIALSPDGILVAARNNFV